MAFVGGTLTEAELAAARLRAAGIPVRTTYGSPWPPFVDPVWRGGFPVVVPGSRLREAKEILGDVESTARPILPRAIAIAVLILLLAPAIASAIQALARR